VPDLRAFKTAARTWEAFGESDPFFGVLSDPTKHGGRWDPDEFFASGRAHVAKLLRTLSDAGATFQPGTCLDFGCGPGRLTVPLSASFQRTVGVDVARPMIEAARRFRPQSASCEFVVNLHPDLRSFESGTFDVVHSCLVLQHIPPDVTLRYIAEFFRVAKPGGVVVFQLPAVRYTEDQISAAHALPDAAFAADIAFVEAPATFEAGSEITLRVRVRNRSEHPWPNDIPAGRHVCLGNHWIREDGGQHVYDDARAFLPGEVGPGETVEMSLGVRAPAVAGRYVLEADLVQEHIAWFAGKGSSPARVAVRVVDVPRVGSDSGPAAATASANGQPVSATGEGSASATTDSATDATCSGLVRPRVTLWRRFLRRVRGGTPNFEMHVVPREEVEKVIQANGGKLLKAVDDNAAGPGWLSYTYTCRKKL
jgi:SAM-dependent methyltransferase